MPGFHKRALCLAVVFALAVATGAGCGDDGDGASTEAATTVPDPNATLAFYDWEPSLLEPGPLSRAAAEKLAQQKPRAIVVADTTPARGGGTQRFYVLVGAPAVTEADIVDPKASVDPIVDEATISFDFTEEGRESFEALTKAVAERGKTEPAHFAIVFDGEVISLPTLDPTRNPDGISAENGAQISGGLTLAKANQVVAALESGG